MIVKVIKILGALFIVTIVQTSVSSNIDVHCVQVLESYRTDCPDMSITVSLIKSIGKVTRKTQILPTPSLETTNTIDDISVSTVITLKFG